MVICHIVLLTAPLQGVINPSLQFAKQLIRIGVKVTVVTSVSAHRRMSKISTTPEGLTFASFSDGYDDGLKDGDDPLQFRSEFKKHGSQAIAELVTASALDGHPMTGLVYTMLQPWVAEVGRDFHIPSAPLWTQPATVFGIYYCYFNGYGDTIRKICSDPSCRIELPGLPQLTRRDLPSFLVPSASNTHDFALPLFKEQLDALDAEANPKILVNTFDGLESEALKAIEKLNLIAIGPLVPSASLDGHDPSDSAFGGDLFQNSKNYVEWLDSKPKSSVVYVSFGTRAVLSKQQMKEIGRGLLESHQPFLWVVRNTEKVDTEEDKLSCRKELEQQGMIVPWCSQVEVLSHPSLGCFVTHCGWNSSLESLVSGVPVVAFPQFNDQPANAKLINDVFKTGVRVTTNEGGIVASDEIKRCIEMVVEGGKEGEEMRRDAKKWKELAKEAAKEGGSLERNLRAFVNEFKETF